MEGSYEPLRQQAANIQLLFRKMLDVPRSDISSRLRTEIDNLVMDIRAKRQPRTIEGRLLKIQQELLQARDKSRAIMRIDENIFLLKHCEQLRSALKKLPHYQ